MMPPRPKAREVMTLREAADWLRVSERTVQELCQRGHLGSFRLIDRPKAQRFTTLTDLRAFVAHRRAQSRA